MKKIQGIPAAPGIAIGPIFIHKSASLTPHEHPVADTAAEWARLTAALERARGQLQVIREKALNSTGAESAAIFDAQAAMLGDPELLERCRKDLASRQINVEVVWRDSVEHFAGSLEALENATLRARAADVRDVGQRVLRVLAGGPEEPPILRQPSIIVAEDLTPSDTIMFDRSLVLGFCTAGGGATSHTAILARSLGLPAVVGAGSELLHLADGGSSVLNGEAGFLLVEPDTAALDKWQAARQARLGLLAEAQSRGRDPAVTLDGRRVEVVANIGSLADARAACENGAEGVGLLRTEFLYLERQSLPDEEEQTRAYASILEVFGSQPVVLRTLDIGGDKAIQYLNLPVETNPFLGVRGLRLCLRRPDLFKPQLRAALRASTGRNLKLMFPMVAAVHEVRAARQVLEDCMAELRAQGRSFSDRLEIGIMVEVPSAAVMAPAFAPYVDFFSIGTNDLTQYTLAADRTNPELANLANAFSPAVLGLIDAVIRAAHEAGKWVGVCGELAGEPLALPILLGLGLDEFSMNSPAIPLAKQTLRGLHAGTCQGFAQRVLRLEDAGQVQDSVRREFPWISA